jgi:hypothetical protein
MKNIFLSRPTWIGPEFSQGLKAFTSILTSHEITPRTLGVSDYPTNTPLDEVISIMDQCVGAIILGYPQIEVKEGFLKGDTIDSSVVLATEWNHIEASLAYAKRLPLLVIHHKGVRRGIFDRGAIGKFLYEVDLSNSTWFSEEHIIGAIVAWKNRLVEAIPEDSPASVQQDDLEFDKASGTYISNDDRTRFCHKCLHSSPSQKVPLQEQDNGWSCSVCNNFYRNPNYNPPRYADNDYHL